MRKTVNTEFEIDSLKAEKIAARLFYEFYNKKDAFANYPMPEYIMPRNLKQGTKEHALYLNICDKY